MVKISNRGQIGNLYNYVLIFVLVGMVLAVGIVLLDKFGDAVRDDTSVLNENHTNGTLVNLPVRSLTIVRANDSTEVTSTNYTFLNDSLIIKYGGSSYFVVNYTYGKNNTASEGIFSTISSITPISTDWMPIIVIVAVLGIVLALVLGAFSQYRNR